MKIHKLREMAMQRNGVLLSNELKENFSKGQLLRMTRNGMLIPLRRGAFVLAGSPITWLQRTIAAVLTLENVAVSHRSAARIHGIGFANWEGVELISPNDKVSPPAVIHFTNTFNPAHLVEAQGMSITNVERTLIDICAITTFKGVQYCLDEALRLGLTRVDRVADMLVQFGQGHRGIRKLKPVIDDYFSDPLTIRSHLERKVFRLVKKLGIQAPVSQYSIRLGGTSRWFDFAWPEYKFALEADSVRWHANVVSFHGDRRRGVLAAALGWRILPVTWETNEDELEAALASCLQLRSS